MIPLISIYRFNTPFFKVTDETIFFENFSKSLNNLIENQGIESQKNIKTLGGSKFIEISLENFGKIELIYSSKIEKIIPLIEINVFFEENFIKNYKTNLIGFLQTFLELFDSKNEDKFCLDFNNIYINYKDLNSSILSLNTVEKSLDKTPLVKTLEKIISTGIIENKNEIEKNYISFAYIVFLMYKNVEKITKERLELENLGNSPTSEVYKGHIDLNLERLTHIENLNITNFKKMCEMLENLYKKLDLVLVKR